MSFSYYLESDNELIIDKELNIVWISSELNILGTLSESRKYLTKFKFNELSDWKIPTKIELERLINFINSNKELSTQFFPDIKDWGYLTSTIYYEKCNDELNFNKEYIWIGNLDTKILRPANKTHKFYLKPCRKL